MIKDPDYIKEFIDKVYDFMYALADVPKWRLFLAMLLLGDKVNNKLKRTLK